MRQVAPGKLKDFVDSLLLASGCRIEVAASVSEGLLWASLRGIDSHGIDLLPHYLAELKAGRLEPNPEISFQKLAPSSGFMDAGHSPGQYVGKLAMQEAIALAENTGIGFVVTHSSSHCGAMGFFSTLAAQEGLIGISMTHATARIRTPGSPHAFFGNNPLCLAAPMVGEDPFCFDSATSVATFNKIRNFAREGKKLPTGWAADANGNPTDNADDAEQLLPIGGYKGFGLSMAVEVLTGVMAGAPTGDEVSEMFGPDLSERRRLAQTFIAINPGGFGGNSGIEEALSDLAARVRSLPPDDIGDNPQVPGDPEKKEFSIRAKEGVPCSDEILEDLVRIGSSLGVDGRYLDRFKE